MKKCLQCKKILIRKVGTERNIHFKNRKFCNYKCYWKYRKNRYMDSNSPRWNGGKYTDKLGYVHIYSFNHPYKDIRNYVLRSRLVMEKHIGRFLNPKEEIHHINKIKNDDRFKNLKLFTTGNEHDSFHSKINFPKGSLFGINKSI